MPKEKCKHEDNCEYKQLGQSDGKPCYICYCPDCNNYFIIWLEEGKNEDFKNKQEYIEFRNSLI